MTGGVDEAALAAVWTTGATGVVTAAAGGVAPAGGVAAAGGVAVGAGAGVMGFTACVIEPVSALTGAAGGVAGAEGGDAGGEGRSVPARTDSEK